MGRFNRAFNRQFVLQNWDKPGVVDIYRRHKREIQLAAEIAAQIFDQKLGGEFPQSNQFQMTNIDSFHLAMDDWDIATMTAGAMANWIHSGLTILAGTAGNAIQFGESLALCVIGIGSLAQSPGINGVELTIDAKKKTRVNTAQAFRASQMKIKELDTAIILRSPQTFLAKIFPGASVADSPYLLGAAFIKENYAREGDPATTTLKDLRALWDVT